MWVFLDSRPLHLVVFEPSKTVQILFIFTQSKSNFVIFCRLADPYRTSILRFLVC